MRNFQRDTRGRGRDADNRDAHRSSMHNAVCSRCGKECEVPFVPNGKKPIFCSNCFESNGGGESRRFERGNGRRDSSKERVMYDAICASCGKNCKIPFQPSNGRPIYCSDCFEKRGDQRTSRVERGNNDVRPQQNDQLQAIHVKLEKILQLLTPKLPPTTSLEEKQIAAVKTESKKKPEDKSPEKKKTKKAKKTTVNPSE